jgi:hypothetical protein
MTWMMISMLDLLDMLNLFYPFRVNRQVSSMTECLNNQFYPLHQELQHFNCIVYRTIQHLSLMQWHVPNKHPKHYKISSVWEIWEIDKKGLRGIIISTKQCNRRSSTKTNNWGTSHGDINHLKNAQQWKTYSDKTMPLKTFIDYRIWSDIVLNQWQTNMGILIGLYYGVHLW